MQIKLGEQMRELRRRNGITQEDLARALGVTAQAVSRWEKGVCYPDMELIPSLANYFGVTIDDVFGCAGEREARINSIIAEANELGKSDNGRDINIEKRLTLLRNALVEFPKNERLMYELAATLSNAGWARVGERIDYDENGYLVHTRENLDNEYWAEAIKLYEALLSDTKDPKIQTVGSYDLTLLYCNIGQYDKSLAIAERMPSLWYSKDMLKPYATDGEDKRKYLAKALLRLADGFANTVAQLLMSKRSNFDGDLPIRMLTGTLKIFDLLFEDGNMGPYHFLVCDLLLYLSEHQWRAGLRDEAFESLNKALEHAKTVDALAKSDEKDPLYTCEFLKGISMEKEKWGGNDNALAPRLPEDWPMWMMPAFDDVAVDMKADPRWDEWAKATQNK